MHTGKAFGAGIIAGSIFPFAMLTGRIAELTDFNLILITGSMVTGALNAWSYVLGLVIYFAVSGVIALIYAAAFERVTYRANMALGAGFGLVHLLAGGAVMGFLPAIHPLLSLRPLPYESLLSPGFFAMNYGSPTVIAFALLHLLYGAIVGAIYRSELRRKWMFRQSSDEHREAA